MGDWTTADDTTEPTGEASEPTLGENGDQNESDDGWFLGEGAPFDPSASHSSEAEADVPVGEPNYVAGIVAASIVAMVGGGIWAGIAIVGFEIGWLAIALGAAVGGTAKKFANFGSPQLGMAAAAIAVGGLIFAKILIGTVGANYIVADEIAADDELTANVLYLIDAEEGRIPPDIQTWYASSDEEYPNEQVARQVAAYEAELDTRAQQMTAEERERVAKRGAPILVEFIPFADRFGLSFYDFLFFGIAVYGAFSLGRDRW